MKIRLNIPVGSEIYIQKKFAWRFLNDEMYDCLKDNEYNEEYIKVTATKEGFSCKKTIDAIERQKEYNTENGITDEIKETILF